MGTMSGRGGNLKTSYKRMFNDPQGRDCVKKNKQEIRRVMRKVEKGKKRKTIVDFKYTDHQSKVTQQNCFLMAIVYRTHFWAEKL